MDLLLEISKKLMDGDDERVSHLTQQAIAQAISPQLILDTGFIAGMATVGERFKAHEMFLPEVLMAAKAMHAGMDQLRPLLISEGIPYIGTVVFGTVQGDVHDIGKNLVSIMLKGAGFEIIDLGNDVAPQRFVETATQRNASVIAMSALLTTTMPVMARVVDLVRQKQLTDRIKIIVGGAPVSAEFAREIGADSYGFDAANAVDRVKELVGKN